MIRVEIVKLAVIALFLFSGNIAAEENGKNSSNDKKPSIWSFVESLEKGFYLQVISSSNQGNLEKIGESLLNDFSDGEINYLKEGDVAKLLLGAYVSKNKAKEAKKRLVDQHPVYQDAFIREINESPRWTIKVMRHMNRCWSKPEKISSAWSASVSLKVSKDLFLHLKKINHCDGSAEYCRSVDNAIDRCMARKLPKPNNADEFETDINVKFQG